MLLFVIVHTNKSESTMSKPISNAAFIKLLSDNNFMNEVFIISAIDNYSRLVIENDPIEHGLIDGDLWLSIAKDMRDKLTSR